MDQVKIVLAILKKYHFWVASVLMVLVAIVCWWAATAGLAAQFEKRKTKLQSDFSNVQKIRVNDPNDDVIKVIGEKEKSLKEEVLKSWEILYNEQKEKNPFPTQVLGEDFKEQFENLKPKEELKTLFRERYLNRIQKYFPTLLEGVDLRRPVEKDPADGEKDAAATGERPRTAGLPGLMGGRALGMGRDASDEQEWTGIVDWNETNLEALKSRFNQWQAAPSTLEVILAQEDLWVIGALLRVIERTNEGATAPTNAAVKRIEALLIGRDAINTQQGSDQPIFQQAGGAAGGGGTPGGMLGGMPGGMGGGMGMGPRMGMGPGGMGPGGLGGGMIPGRGGMGPGLGAPGGMGGGMTPGAGGEAATAQLLIQNRYVDNKGIPLPATSEYPYAQHPYAEFKMMPVRMNLVMDQRRIPKLLVECANCSMPIEVQRVRILKTESSSRGGGAGGGMGLMGGMTGPQTMDDPSQSGVNEVPVEIQGVIYIYNPPDREKLGTGAASKEQPTDASGESPAETPLAPSATPPVTPATPAATPATKGN